MKIQCDVCYKDEASLFCNADEAALCDTCDRRIHHANKLASKHHRFTLLHPSSSKQAPLCDVCQEKRAFLFCQQDRAILCRDCDVPIHSANEHTQKHDRFLLTGIKLSATSAPYSASVPQFTSQQLAKNPVSATPANFNPSSLAKSSSVNTTTRASALINKSSGDHNLLASGGVGSTSRISAYLTEMVPGWHVEDFLIPHHLPLVFTDDGNDLGNMRNFSPESLELWVSQSPSSLYPPPCSSQLGGQIGFKETNQIIGMKGNRSWTDDALTVPQISPPSSGSKRYRPFW